MRVETGLEHALEFVHPAGHFSPRPSSGGRSGFLDQSAMGSRYSCAMVIAGLRQIRQSITHEIRVYRLVLEDSRCPRRSKVLLGVALAYLAIPFDLIPDFIPIIGQLDDAIIVPVLVWLALRSIPEEVMNDCRRRVAEGVGEGLHGMGGDKPPSARE